MIDRLSRIDFSLIQRVRWRKCNRGFNFRKGRSGFRLTDNNVAQQLHDRTAHCCCERNTWLCQTQQGLRWTRLSRNNDDTLWLHKLNCHPLTPTHRRLGSKHRHAIRQCFSTTLLLLPLARRINCSILDSTTCSTETECHSPQYSLIKNRTISRHSMVHSRFASIRVFISKRSFGSWPKATVRFVNVTVTWDHVNKIKPEIDRLGLLIWLEVYSWWLFMTVET